MDKIESLKKEYGNALVSNLQFIRIFRYMKSANIHAFIIKNKLKRGNIFMLEEILIFDSFKLNDSKVN